MDENSVGGGWSGRVQGKSQDAIEGVWGMLKCNLFPGGVTEAFSVCSSGTYLPRGCRKAFPVCSSVGKLPTEIHPMTA
jgi:hypothetical protein